MLAPGKFQQINGSSTAATAGAAPQTIAGATVMTNRVQRGTLTALVVANARTNTLTLAGQWQVSDDNSTFYKVVPQNNAAVVVQVTGTGSDVTSTVAYDAPSAVYSFKYSRFALVTGVGSADGTNDKGTISYRYIKA